MRVWERNNGKYGKELDTQFASRSDLLRSRSPQQVDPQTPTISIFSEKQPSECRGSERENDEQKAFCTCSYFRCYNVVYM